MTFKRELVPQQAQLHRSRWIQCPQECGSSIPPRDLVSTIEKFLTPEVRTGIPGIPAKTERPIKTTVLTLIGLKIAAPIWDVKVVPSWLDLQKVEWIQASSKDHVLFRQGNQKGHCESREWSQKEGWERAKSWCSRHVGNPRMTRSRSKCRQETGEGCHVNQCEKAEAGISIGNTTSWGVWLGSWYSTSCRAFEIASGI